MLVGEHLSLTALYTCFKEWKKKDALQRLCMMRALRPDRMTYAVQGFVEEKLGAKFVEHRSIEFGKSFEESGMYMNTNTRRYLFHNFIHASE